MRHLRPFLALLAIAAITVACSSSSSSPGGNAAEQSSGASSEASQPAQSTEASQPAQSTGGGGGGGANGSVHYEISGDYTASGDLPWQPLASTFASGTWYLTFGEASGGGTSDALAISGSAGTYVVIFGNAEIVIISGVEPACSFTVTRQDANGAAGSFDCHGLQASRATDGTVVTVDFKGDFEGHI